MLNLVPDYGQNTGFKVAGLAEKLNRPKNELGFQLLNHRLEQFVIKEGIMIASHPATKTPADYGLSYNKVTFESIDGLKLDGWFISATEARATLILAHGYRRNKAYFLSHASWLHEAGYNLFMFDFRAHGDSEGPHGTSIGFMERLDILGAVNYLVGQGQQNLGILGVSMGASAAIMAAAENPNISCVIADSPYAQLYRSITNMIKMRQPVPGFVATQAAKYAAGVLARHHNFEPNLAQPLDYVERLASDRLLFLIHGKADRLTGVENSLLLLERSGNRAQLWSEIGVDHVQMYKKFPKEYQIRTLAFLNSAFDQRLSQQAA